MRTLRTLCFCSFDRPLLAVSVSLSSSTDFLAFFWPPFLPALALGSSPLSSALLSADADASALISAGADALDCEQDSASAR